MSGGELGEQRLAALSLRGGGGGGGGEQQAGGGGGGEAGGGGGGEAGGGDEAGGEGVAVPGYRPPAHKSLREIQEMDTEDDSLRKYKEKLLGGGAVVQDPSVPNVQVTRLTLICKSAPEPLTLDLTGNLEAFKKQAFVLKEGVEYRIKISFKVNREIVSGLRYLQNTYRGGVRVDKANYMVGSYGPRPEDHEFLTPVEEAPKGLLARGSYNVRSQFTDDDRSDHLSWEWNLKIHKEWRD